MNLKQSMTKMTGKASLTIKKYSPEILLGAGIVGLVGSTVMACQATPRIEEVVDEAKETLESINDVLNDETYADKYTEEDATKDKAIIYIQSGVKMLKIYAPAISLGVLSVAAILTSHNIMKKRNLAVVAAYKAAEESFSSYRKRVVEELGKDKDLEFRHGVTKIEETVEEIDEKGKKKKVKKVHNVVDPNEYSQYARFYDDGNTNWDKSPEVNLMFLRAQQQYANDLLLARGHLFLNEVYDMLGIPRSQAGSVVGWVVSEDGDNFVDFGIYNGLNTDLVNGYEPTILLDFNVDGVIYNLI